MNTIIHLWIDPLYVGHEKSKGKLYFYLTVKEDLSELSNEEIENDILEAHITNILDFADVQQNWNYGVVSQSQTEEYEYLTEAPSPKEIKAKQKAAELQVLVTNFVEDSADVQLSKANVEAKDNGLIEVNYPKLKVSDTINFGNLWNSIEKSILGKLTHGDSAVIKDEFGNTLFDLRGGNYLSLVSPDIEVLNTRLLGDDHSFVNRLRALKGGVYVRDNGILAIGDVNRTFYLEINTGNLLKASLKLGKSLNELTSGDELIKLLPETNKNQS